MKNFNHITKFILLLLISLVIISCEKKPAGVKIEYSKSLEPITLRDKTLQSYSVNYKMNLNRQSVLDMAKKLTDESLTTLDLKNISETEKGMMVLRNEKDPSASFEMDTRSGNFLFNGGLKNYKKEGDTPNLISADKASSVALEHLAKLKLVPGNQELDLVHTGGLNMAVLNKDSTTDIYKKLVTVRYNRKLDGVPVMGDSRIVMNMGKDGSLAGLTYYWGKITDRKKFEPGEALTDEEIKGQLEKRLGDAAADAKRILVEKARFVLYDDGQGHIEPAYHIQAELFYEESLGDSGKTTKAYDVPYDFYIPVLKKHLAFYPYMETAEVQPKDIPEDTKITPEDDD